MLHSNATLYATLRFKRKPVSNAIVCLKLRVAHALPVHAHALHECDISDNATLHCVNDMLAALAQRFKCKHVELDVRRDVIARLERNAG